MQSVLISLLVPIAFFALVVMFWLAIHLLASKRLGEREQGCKGPVRGKGGAMLCCKGDGTPCEDFDEKAQRE